MSVLLAVLATGHLAGCAGWDTWPQQSGSATPNRNSAPAIRSMELALARVIARAGPEGGEQQPVAISVPTDLVTDPVYRRMAERIMDEPGVTNIVVPLTVDRTDLPVYHVAGVRVRAGRAEVDVLRPVFGAGELDASELGLAEAYQGFEVRLEGGVRPWRVTWIQEYSPGVTPVPPLSFAGAEGDASAEAEPDLAVDPPTEQSDGG
ncbi:MAG: hypothetical protein AAFX79_09535 [Planctomycetota bacterium]